MREFRFRMKVPWSDTDAAMVVHFSNYFKYFERTELEFYDNLGFNYAKTLDRSTLWFPRVEAHCRYLSPCHFDDEIEVSMTLSELKEKSVRYDMKLFNLTTQKISAEGYIVVASVDKRIGKAVPIPKDFAEAIARYFRD